MKWSTRVGKFSDNTPNLVLQAGAQLAPGDLLPHTGNGSGTHPPHLRHPAVCTYRGVVRLRFITPRAYTHTHMKPSFNTLLLFISPENNQG